jgi:predicted SAM-dependent methyltransferase
MMSPSYRRRWGTFVSFLSNLWPLELDPVQQARTSKRLNIGCGFFPLPYYTNIDEDPSTPADRHLKVPPLPYEDASLEEIYGGHFFEHLVRRDAQVFLQECYRCLEPGGTIALMVPDMRAIMRRWLDGPHDCIQTSEVEWHNTGDLDDLCHWVIYSTIQPSRHQWAYDRETLARALTRSGFTIVGEFDRNRDRRVARPAWYQVGVEAKKPL